MFKKLLFIFLAGVILVTLLGTDAAAKCTFKRGKLVCSDLTTEAVISGVNIKRDPTFCSAVYIGYANADRLVNRGNNSSQSVSHIFVPDILPPDVIDVTVEYLVDRGLAEVESSWDWDGIWSFVAANLGAPNHNWSVTGTECIDNVWVGMYIEQEHQGVLQLQDSYCLECTTGCETAWTDCENDQECEVPELGLDCGTYPPLPTIECAANNSCYGFSCTEKSWEECEVRGLLQACREAIGY